MQVALFEDREIYAPGLLSEVNLEQEIRRASAQHRLKCPHCGDSAIFKGGPVNAWHFAHFGRRICPIRELEDYQPETELHKWGKYVIWQWLLGVGVPVDAIHIEARIPETNQIADVLLHLPDYPRVAFEVQNTPIQSQTLKRRRQCYAEAGIVDVWILIGDAAPGIRGVLNQRISLSSLARALASSQAELITLTPKEPLENMTRWPEGILTSVCIIASQYPSLLNGFDLTERLQQREQLSSLLPYLDGHPPWSATHLGTELHIDIRTIFEDPLRRCRLPSKPEKKSVEVEQYVWGLQISREHARLQAAAWEWDEANVRWHEHYCRVRAQKKARSIEENRAWVQRQESSPDPNIFDVASQVTGHLWQRDRSSSNRQAELNLDAHAMRLLSRLEPKKRDEAVKLIKQFLEFRGY